MVVQNVAAPDLNPDTCIDDWTVIHWAVEVPKPDWITETVHITNTDNPIDFP
jgi:hypothetical protein